MLTGVGRTLTTFGEGYKVCPERRPPERPPILGRLTPLNFSIRSEIRQC
jgi:hypothetical protein